MLALFSQLLVIITHTVMVEEEDMCQVLVLVLVDPLLLALSGSASALNVPVSHI